MCSVVLQGEINLSRPSRCTAIISSLHVSKQSDHKFIAKSLMLSTARPASPRGTPG